MQIEVSVGDKIRIYGEQYMVVECKSNEDKCVRCALKYRKMSCYYLACIPEYRRDNKNIYFEHVEL